MSLTCVRCEKSIVLMWFYFSCTFIHLSTLSVCQFDLLQPLELDTDTCVTAPIGARTTNLWVVSQTLYHLS